jgi:hypothetical protein
MCQGSTGRCPHKDSCEPKPAMKQHLHKLKKQAFKINIHAGLPLQTCIGIPV